MKLLILISTLLFLISCSDKDQTLPEESGKPAQGEEEQPRDFSWGELPCQYDRSCQTVALNFSSLEWVDFFVQNFSALEQQEREDGHSHFLCGYRVEKKASEFFRRNSNTAEHDFTQVSDFFLKIIDPKTCAIKTDVRKALSQYFKQSEEYVHETN